MKKVKTSSQTVKEVKSVKTPKTNSRVAKKTSTKRPATTIALSSYNKLQKDFAIKIAKLKTILELSKKDIEKCKASFKVLGFKLNIKTNECIKLDNSITSFNSLPWYKKMFFKF